LSEKLRVIFDINVWLDAFLGEPSDYPYLPIFPPGSENDAANCVSMAFDGERFSVFASPHILTNVHRVLKAAGLSDQLCHRYIEDLSDIVFMSGGSVVDPSREAASQRDFEDNLILDLAKATASEVVVTRDVEFTNSSGWKGVAIISPSVFVKLALNLPNSD